MTMELDRSLYPGVPEDFPIEWEQGVVSGAQRKLLLVVDGGKYYRGGTASIQKKLGNAARERKALWQRTVRGMFQ